MEYDEKLDKKIIKEIERNELIKLIYENCNNKNMNLIICKKIKGFEFLEEIEEDYITDNFEFFYKNNLQKDYPLIYPYYPSYNNEVSNIKSSTYYGKKDFHLELSFIEFLGDKPKENIKRIENKYDKIIRLKKTIKNLQSCDKFKDIELMCPNPRIRGDETYIIGFNEVL